MSFTPDAAHHRDIMGYMDADQIGALLRQARDSRRSVLLIFKEAMQARRIATALPIRLDDIPGTVISPHQSAPKLAPAGFRISGWPALIRADSRTLSQNSK